MEGPIFWTPGLTIREMTKQVILKASLLCEGNVAQVANMLGMSERGIRYKLQRYGAESENAKSADAASRVKETNESRVAVGLPALKVETPVVKPVVEIMKKAKKTGT